MNQSIFNKGYVYLSVPKVNMPDLVEEDEVFIKLQKGGCTDNYFKATVSEICGSNMILRGNIKKCVDELGSWSFQVLTDDEEPADRTILYESKLLINKS